ncbi:hypothetical protein Pint_12348 [Pistacia integerrima]|uniref:Uncharacterized protein n=1 Tax=Pistacia integerrima TaxID=434235 RepID=A0ACC0XLB5_9ROSI|nr:hypothetical protein Pint_12348 [Pistacia integerrima]
MIEEETVLLLQNSISFSKEIERRSRHFKLYRGALEGDWNTTERIYKEEDIDIPVKLSKDGAPLSIFQLQQGTLVFSNWRQKDVEYLYEATADVILDHDNDLIELLISLINRGWYDVSLHLVERHPQIALARDKNEETALHRLARLPVLTRILDFNAIKNCKKSAIYLYTGQEIPDSAFELVECLWKQVMLLVLDDYPDWKLLENLVDENNYTILHAAVRYRRRNIFNAMYHIGPFKDLLVRNTDKEGNNILHLAAKLPPVDTPDIESLVVTCLLKREIWWFEGVKRILHPVVAEAKNNERKTPRALFTEQYKELREKADKWTKKTANACIMVLVIIAIVVFATLFTVPGGTKENIGTPNFLRRASFIVFAISDTIALLLSSYSITMFLSVISSRCEEADFFWPIGGDFARGMFSVLYSVEAMMGAFSATMFIVFKDGWLWVPVLLAIMVVFTTLMYVGKTLTINGEVLHAVYENR